MSSVSAMTFKGCTKPSKNSNSFYSGPLRKWFPDRQTGRQTDRRTVIIFYLAFFLTPQSGDHFLSVSELLESISCLEVSVHPGR